MHPLIMLGGLLDRALSDFIYSLEYGLLSFSIHTLTTSLSNCRIRTLVERNDGSTPSRSIAVPKRLLENLAEIHWLGPWSREVLQGYRYRNDRFKNPERPIVAVLPSFMPNKPPSRRPSESFKYTRHSSSAINRSAAIWPTRRLTSNAGASLCVLTLVDQFC